MLVGMLYLGYRIKNDCFHCSENNHGQWSKAADQAGVACVGVTGIAGWLVAARPWSKDRDRDREEGRW